MPHARRTHRFFEEMRARLVELHERLRGEEDFGEALVQPHRQLLREGELREVSREGGGGGGAASVNQRGAPKYGLLCNDSFWLCETLRGNRFNLLHVFHFEDVVQKRLGARGESGDGGEASSRKKLAKTGSGLTAMLARAKKSA